jgi:hypothetical protein
MICPVCNKKMITQKVLDGHLRLRHPEIELASNTPPVENIETPPQPPVVESVTETPVAAPVVTEPEPIGITLHFTQNVEVNINGRSWAGKEIVVPDMETATEIVRICKEAYGPNVLER